MNLENGVELSNLHFFFPFPPLAGVATSFFLSFARFLESSSSSSSSSSFYSAFCLPLEGAEFLVSAFLGAVFLAETI